MVKLASKDPGAISVVVAMIDKMVTHFSESIGETRTTQLPDDAYTSLSAIFQSIVDEQLRIDERALSIDALHKGFEKIV